MHALNEAEVLRLSSPVTLDALIARHPRRTGTHALRRALEIQRQRGETVIRSDFETAFLDFAERYGLPRPQMNEPVGPYEPDAIAERARHRRARQLRHPHDETELRERPRQRPRAHPRGLHRPPHDLAPAHHA